MYFKLSRKLAKIDIAVDVSWNLAAREASNIGNENKMADIGSDEFYFTISFIFEGLQFIKAAQKIKIKRLIIFICIWCHLQAAGCVNSGKNLKVPN